MWEEQQPDENLKHKRTTSDSDEVQVEAKRICARKDDVLNNPQDYQSFLTATDSLKVTISSSAPTLLNEIYPENLSHQEETLQSSAPPEISTEMADKAQTKNRDETEQPTQDHQEDKHDDENQPTDKQDGTARLIDDLQSNTESTNEECPETNQLAVSQSLKEPASDNAETLKIDITDSQLVWAAGTVGNPIPPGNGGIHEVTSLLKGLINELSSLNRFILDANKQMEAARRQRQDTLRKSKRRVHLGTHQRH